MNGLYKLTYVYNAINQVTFVNALRMNIIIWSQILRMNLRITFSPGSAFSVSKMSKMSRFNYMISVSAGFDYASLRRTEPWLPSKCKTELVLSTLRILNARI